MKKVLVILIMMLGMLNAGNMYKGYDFNMPKSEITGLTQIDNLPEFPEPFKVYKDDYGQIFVFSNNKLKAVVIMAKGKDLKKAIEENIKNGFRLQKIDVKTKYGKEKVANVAELMNLVKKISDEAELFDSFIVADLLFKYEDSIIVMTYKNYMQRDSQDCIKCEFVNGKVGKNYELIQYIFTRIK